ncbi:MAG: indole-3-glycerol-phosphate synthase, partial [Nitrososphaerota archaeon]
YSELSIEEAIQKIHSLGMEVLLEVHTREELLEASALDVDLIGVNSRNLETMNVETDNFIHSIANIDVNNRVLVAESGINSPEQISMLKKLGYKAFLIGTAIMKSNDVEQAVKSFVGDP